MSGRRPNRMSRTLLAPCVRSLSHARSSARYAAGLCTERHSEHWHRSSEPNRVSRSGIADRSGCRSTRSSTLANVGLKLAISAAAVAVMWLAVSWASAARPRVSNTALKRSAN